MNGDQSQSDKNAALADEIDRHPVTLRLPHKCKPNSLEIETDGRALSYDENRAIIDALRASRSAELGNVDAIAKSNRLAHESLGFFRQAVQREASAPASNEPALEALRELVECKALIDDLDADLTLPGPKRMKPEEREAKNAEYRTRKPLAWAAARRIVGVSAKLGRADA